MYADLRYQGGVHGVTGIAEPDLVLTDDESLISASNTGSNESVAYMGLLTTLIDWHDEDPVDDFERDRNDVVFSYQGNRNPFVDHPEWVDLVFSTGGVQCSVPADCDDGKFCNGAESCMAGTCVAGTDPCGADLVCNETQQLCQAPPMSGTVWINEIHYDNVQTDTGEFLEIAGFAGTDLSDWSVYAYNGATGTVYAQVPLSGVLPDQLGCAGTLSFPLVGMQNGSPDGLALVDAMGEVVEFISYEGAFSVSSGPASGELSVDIGVSESNSTPIGSSLQLGGTGAFAADFLWQTAAPETPGLPNLNQTLDTCDVPEPTSLGAPLLYLGLLAATRTRGVSRRTRARERAPARYSVR